MPYHGKDIKPVTTFSRHAFGRYVSDHMGYLRGKEGDRVDLNAFLTEHSPSVEVVSVETKIMRASGLLPGGFVLVDRSRRTVPGSLVFVRYNGQPIIRRLVKNNEDWFLIADDPRENDLPINKNVEVEKLGVVIASILRF